MDDLAFIMVRYSDCARHVLAENKVQTSVIFLSSYCNLDFDTSLNIDDDLLNDLSRRVKANK